MNAPVAPPSPSCPDSSDNARKFTQGYAVPLDGLKDPYRAHVRSEVPALATAVATRGLHISQMISIGGSWQYSGKDRCQYNILRDLSEKYM